MQTIGEVFDDLYGTVRQQSDRIAELEARIAALAVAAVAAESSGAATEIENIIRQIKWIQAACAIDRDAQIELDVIDFSLRQLLKCFEKPQST